jgi:hypothetical protein
MEDLPPRRFSSGSSPLTPRPSTSTVTTESAAATLHVGFPRAGDIESLNQCSWQSVCLTPSPSTTPFGALENKISNLQRLAQPRGTTSQPQNRGRSLTTYCSVPASKLHFSADPDQRYTFTHSARLCQLVFDDRQVSKQYFYILTAPVSKPALRCSVGSCQQNFRFYCLSW